MSGGGPHAFGTRRHLEESVAHRTRPERLGVRAERRSLHLLAALRGPGVKAGLSAGALLVVVAGALVWGLSHVPQPGRSALLVGLSPGEDLTASRTAGARPSTAPASMITTAPSVRASPNSIAVVTMRMAPQGGQAPGRLL